ncbi:MAG: hypothetical protein K1X72_23325 [Pyrinomonadaceae bacterium]|nr:hypothetical protein [Pyrinomonadaceae bacterium]
MTPEQVSKYLGISINNKIKKTKTYVRLNRDELKVNSNGDIQRSPGFNIGEKELSLINPKQSDLYGISSVKLTFYKDVLYNIQTNYSENYVKWESLSDLVDSLSMLLNLPRNEWHIIVVSEITPAYCAIVCNDFSMTAQIRHDNSNRIESILWLQNESISQGVIDKARKKYFQNEKIKKRKKIFKP